MQSFVRLYRIGCENCEQDKERNVLWPAIEPPLNPIAVAVKLPTIFDQTVCALKRTNFEQNAITEHCQCVRMWAWFYSDVHKWYDTFFMVFCVFLWFVLLSCMHSMLYDKHFIDWAICLPKSFMPISNDIHINFLFKRWLDCHFVDWVNDCKCMFVITRTISKWKPKQAQINCRWTTLDM